MRTLLLASLLALGGALPPAAAELHVVVEGLVNPESACVGPEGVVYVTEIGERNKEGDGRVLALRGGKAEPFATGLNDPKGIAFLKDAFYVTDVTRVMKIDLQGKVTELLAADAFPNKPRFLNDAAIFAGTNTLLVSDSGDFQGNGGAVYRVDLKSRKVDAVADTNSLPGLHTPNGVVFEGQHHFLLADFASGALYRVKLADKSAEKIAEGMEGADGLVWDHFGRLFISSWKTGKVFGIARPGEKPVLVAEGMQSAADACLAPEGDALLVPDMLAGKLIRVPASIPGWEVDETPLAVELKPAFPNLVWTGWDDGSESGKPNPFRPILLTHAGDGSNRVFVPSQQGVVHVFENSDDAKQTTVFLDISDRVRYLDKQNEEGLLGLAFHPRFKENGELFIFYTDVNAKMKNVVSRFRLSKENPAVADPASEERLIEFEKPYWNHDGGTIAFGPDGYLYITHGDGGSGGDPHKNGQNLDTLLGTILRIDVDKPSAGKKYGIPADNPFVGRAGARPEIYAYGLRNVWRMAFDRETGRLWAGEVGQNLYEEINLIEPGGNYGWSLRESLHPFGDDGVGPRPELIDPIWEYHHDIGKSITGGVVYRGQQVPELQGLYLYADYVSARMWALRYDEAKGRVTANHPLPSPNVATLSFGEDEAGEVYLLSASPTGRGIFRFTKAAAE